MKVLFLIEHITGFPIFVITDVSSSDVYLEM